MPAGRRRTVSLPPDEMIKLGQEMVEWVKLNNPLHLSEWYTIEKGFTYNQWKTFIVIKEFFPYYEIALKWVGKQYLDKDSRIRDGISQRWQRVYFQDIREQEDSDYDRKLEKDLEKEIKKMKEEYRLKKAELETETELYMQANKKLDAFNNQISSLQSERKIADSNVTKAQ